MKVLIIVLCFLAPYGSGLFGQTSLYVGSGTNFYMGSGSVVYMDGLSFNPSSGYNITGLNMESRNTTVNHPLSKSYIKRVYHFSSTTAAFSGAITMYYQDAELNGITESNLNLHIYNGSAWNKYTLGVTRNTTANYVSTNVSLVPVNELTLADGTIVPPVMVALPDGNASEVSTGFGAFPNPVKSFTMISLVSHNAGMLNLQLYDGKGAIVREKKLGLDIGNQRIPFDMEGLISGTYTLVATWDNTTRIIRLIKE